MRQEQRQRRSEARVLDDSAAATLHRRLTYYGMLVLAAALALVLSGMAHAQTADAAAGGDTLRATAARLLAGGRGNEARILLQSAARQSTVPAQRFGYRLLVGDSYLYDGDFPRALTVYEAVLSHAGAALGDSLTSRLHHGMALAEAFSGHSTQAATHYGEALAARAAITDSIEMLIVTGQHDLAAQALDRSASGTTTDRMQQFVAAYRAFNAMEAGHCTDALAMLAKAPHPELAVPLAVRGRCAAKHGQRAAALALKDSVLKQPSPNPFAWPAIIARDVARKIR